MTTPRVSVIVPVRNEARAIRHTLECLLRQDFDRDDFEVLVVDGQSDDETVAIVREMQPRFGRLKLLYNPKRWSSAARNTAIRHALGEYIVIVDGHCAIDNSRYLRDLVRSFTETGADCLARPQPLDADGASPFQRGVAYARRSWLGHNPDSAIFSDRPGFVEPQNVAVAYRRNVFAVVGLFDERFDACEDVEFNTRVHRHGLRCYFTPAIGVRYHPRSSLRGLWRQMFRYGTGRARLGRKHPSSRSLPSLIPPFWMVWLAGTLAAGILWSPALAAFGLCAIAYFAVVLGESLRLTGGRLVPALRLPLIFCALHAGFGWGFLKESFARARTSHTASR